MNPISSPLPFNSPLTKLFIEKFDSDSLEYIGVNNTEMFDSVGAQLCDSPASAFIKNPASGPVSCLYGVAFCFVEI